MQVVLLNNVPVLDDMETVLLCGDAGVAGDCYVAQRPVKGREALSQISGSDKLESNGTQELVNNTGDSAATDYRIVAFIDGTTANGYAAKEVAEHNQSNPCEAGEKPLVRIVGNLSDTDGQVTILQEEGHYRRYSRWDRINPLPDHPYAVVRTLPQCGCGGYLGAPMIFDSFAEMTAYFFVVFSDAAAVNAKHAANICGIGKDSTCKQ